MVVQQGSPTLPSLLPPDPDLAGATGHASCGLAPASSAIRMTQEPTSLLPIWARTPTTRRPKSRRHQLPISSGAMEEAHDHRPASSSSTGRPFLSGLCAAALRRKPLGAHASTAAAGEGLVRQLGVLELVLLGIGASIGAGIFVITGTVARDAGPGPLYSPILI